MEGVQVSLGLLHRGSRPGRLRAAWSLLQGAQCLGPHLEAGSALDPIVRSLSLPVVLVQFPWIQESIEVALRPHKKHRRYLDKILLV